MSGRRNIHKYTEIIRLLSERFPDVEPKTVEKVIQLYMGELSRKMDDHLEFRDKYLGAFRHTEKGFNQWIDHELQTFQSSIEEGKLYHLLVRMKRWQREMNLFMNPKVKRVYEKKVKTGRHWANYRHAVNRNIRINCIQKEIRIKTLLNNKTNRS